MTSYSDVMKLFSGGEGDSSSASPKKKKEVQFPRKWIVNDDYQLYRKGIPLRVHPDDLKNMESLSERCLYLFKHKGDVVKYTEDKQRPLWRGVLKIASYPEDTFFIPTQDHEKIIYKDRPAKHYPLGGHNEDGTPYWVDSYYHKKQREKKNKKKHTSKKKQEMLQKKHLMDGLPSLDDQQLMFKEESDSTTPVASSKANKRKKTSTPTITPTIKKNRNASSIGLPLDDITFFEMELQTAEKLKKNCLLSNTVKNPNSSKIVKKSLATASSCNQITKIAIQALDLLFTREGRVPEPTDATSTTLPISSIKKRRPIKKQKVDTTPLKRTVDDPVKEFIREQFKMAHSGNTKEVTEIIMEAYESGKKGMDGAFGQNMGAYIRDYHSTPMGQLLVAFHHFLTK